MRRLHLVLAAVFLATVTADGAGAPNVPAVRSLGPLLSVWGQEPVPSLRPLHDVARRLIEDGMARSATFRSLVSRLEGSDVIVYVEVRPDLGNRIGGFIRFVGTTSTHRIVRVTVSSQHNWATMLSLLGHELQHAVEVADAPDIVCQHSMRRYYQEAGIRVGPDTYDSTAAQVTGWTVRAELRVGPRDTRLARARQDTEERLLSGGSIGGELMP
jgi:hypothetical protein